VRGKLGTLGIKVVNRPRVLRGRHQVEETVPITPPLLYCEQLPRFAAAVVVAVARCVGFSDSVGHCWLAGWSWSWWIHEAGVSADKM
jgi:hypothetical protein